MTQWIAHFSFTYLLSIAYLALLACMILIERCVPNASSHSGASMRFNIVYALVMLAILAALKPLAMVVPLMLTKAVGAGWLSFPATTLGWFGAFVALLLVTDFLEYAFHRAQHSVPFLWRMHQLHHSAEHFDVTLAYRHFWLEPLIKTAFIYPLPGILLKSPGSAIAVVAGIGQVFQYVAHMNARFSPPGLGLLVTHPQYHRVHHSKAAIHYNKNLCALLPLWDILFGTLHRPRPDERVDVGLETEVAPHTLWMAVSLPFRPTVFRVIRAEAAHKSA
jgi:sterol desaturase/sphingolipid hydroxylase (fatty acid hydroxylase superfamily)